MADIKTRDVVTGTIKAIDKSAVAAERMKDAFIRTKDVGRILRTFKIKKNVEVTDNGKIII